MDWLKLLREALDDAHGDHDEACDCYDRLCDGLDGVYRFPDHSFGPVPPPVYGCKTQMDAAFDAMSARIAEAVYADTNTLRMLGLGGALGINTVMRG